ncbi:MAG: esterase-like activity of phytase family protein [Planctomycetaceae bacterium]|jgi:hypothetical protein|nr:esterase-like activity of phytase family protein [Phycisphaerales bacterium]MCE2654062.1 esterase-like activity of phytase family protein [Planctomycetaceae bacterium]
MTPLPALLSLAGLLTAPVAPATPPLQLIARLAIPADATDTSGLEGVIGSNIPHNRLSFGSAIHFAPTPEQPHRFIALPDRGPGDGASAYRVRTVELALQLDAQSPSPLKPIQWRVLATHLLTDQQGGQLWGYTGGFNEREPAASIRLDPEGLVVDPAGNLWISDEYGPWLDCFAPGGRRIRRLAPPPGFTVARQGNPEQELPPHNAAGRQPNRGLEGLAITPDGAALVAILQGPLIQDGALDADNKRIGHNVRLFRTPLAGGPARQHIYQLQRPANGVNEILAVSNDRFIVLERDGKAGSEARHRALYLIDTSVATDVSAIPALPSGPDLSALAGVRPVSKRLLLDFTDPAFGLTGPDMPEKIEGLSFGPPLPDGRRTLWVSSDNDFRDGVPTWIWVFALAPEALNPGPAHPPPDPATR